MGCLAQTVALGDIRDVDGMVGAAISRTGLVLSGGEREELEAEGLLILCELQAGWDGRGSFAGYASSLLGRRLITAWHRLGQHSRRRVFEADGSWAGVRVWRAPPVVSLDALLGRRSPEEYDEVCSGFDETRLRRVVADRPIAA